MKIFEFEAIIQKHDGMNAAYIEFPYSVEEVFETKGQVKVKVDFEGYVYRGSLVNMGLKLHCIGITQKIRKTIGKEPGDKINVKLERDTKPRIVELPKDFEIELAQSQAAALFYKSLSYSRQKAYVTWITSAKKVETRKRRLDQSLQFLKDKKNSPFLETEGLLSSLEFWKNRLPNQTNPKRTKQIVTLPIMTFMVVISIFSCLWSLHPHYWPTSLYILSTQSILIGPFITL